jgi:hypothetical protein
MEHIVELFDTSASRADRIARFIRQATDDGASLLVAARPRHWVQIATRLERSRFQIDRATTEGHLTIVDAEVLVASFMRRGQPDPTLFEHHVGRLVKRLAQNTAPLRIYAEIVEVLAEEGNFRAAQQVEDMWNVLGRLDPFRLLCGYSAAHFAAPSARVELKTICNAHSAIRSKAGDTLSTWLLRETAPAAESAG